MPVTSLDLCGFADQMAVESSDETQLRASVSRAYYAGFHAALPLVSRLPHSSKFRPGSVNITHEDFATRLSEWKTEGVHPVLSSMKTRAGQLARATDANRAMRLKADYKMTSTITVGDAKMQVQRTRQIMRALADIDLAMNPAQAADEVKA